MRPTKLHRANLLFFTLLFVPSAQAQVCRAADDSSYAMIEMIKPYALARDSSWMAARDSLRVPAVSDSTTIKLITKEVTCKSANSAYQLAAGGARQTLTGRVYVVQIGASFLVWDPGYLYNPQYPKDVYMVFNSKWVRQSIF